MQEATFEDPTNCHCHLMMMSYKATLLQTSFKTPAELLNEKLVRIPLISRQQLGNKQTRDIMQWSRQKKNWHEQQNIH